MNLDHEPYLVYDSDGIPGELASGSKTTAQRIFGGLSCNEIGWRVVASAGLTGPASVTFRTAKDATTLQAGQGMDETTTAIVVNNDKADGLAMAGFPVGMFIPNAAVTAGRLRVYIIRHTRQ